MSYDTLTTISKAITQEPTGLANANEGNTRLINYNIYEGTVLDVDYLSKTMTVYVNNIQLKNCVYAANAIAGLLGFSSTALPPVGSVVMCLYTSTITWVIGTQPQFKRNIAQYVGDITNPSEYSQIGDKNLSTKHDQWAAVSPGYGSSRDLLPGEEEITNNLGVALRLLTNLAQLDAGGLAKIECHLLNDMVRIVDLNFAHHHCGGDTFIWSNGRNNYESHFTSYPHEASGKLTEDESYATPNDILGKQDVYDNIGDAISGAGRWRKSTYLGFLGDMLHFWITHPVDVISNYAQQAARASRFKTWVGADGTLVVQAAGDIMIDVTQHMVIPEIHYKWDDPSYDPDKVLEQLDIEYLKIWGPGDKHWEDLSVACWQMRNYLKYLTVWHSLQRFRQLANVKDGEPYCTIKSEAENPVGNINCGEQDKLQANGEVKGTESAAGTCQLHMCPDGSITLLSGNSLSCIMNNGNMQLVAPFNIEIKAGNNFSVTAKDVSIKAYRNIELVSMFGSLYLKAKAALKALCEAGRVWIKGDAPSKELSTVIPAEFNKYSVVIDSSQGETLVHGNKGVTIGSDDQNGHVTIETTGANGRVNILSNIVNTVGKTGVYLRSKLLGIYSSATAVFGTKVNLFNKFEFSRNGGQFDAPVNVYRLASPNVLYAKVFQSYNTPHLSVTSEKWRETTQENATPTVSDDSKVEEYIKDNVTEKKLLQNYIKEEFKNGKDKWALFEWKVDNKKANSNMSLKADPWSDTFINCAESLAQDWLNSYVAVRWDMDSVKLNKAPRTQENSIPWPGKDAKFFVFTKTTDNPAPVGEKWDKDFTVDDIGSLSDMTPQPIIYHFYTKPEDKDVTEA